MGSSSLHLIRSSVPPPLPVHRHRSILIALPACVQELHPLASRKIVKSFSQLVLVDVASTVGAGATRVLGATETIASRMAFLYGPQEMGRTFHHLEDWGSEVSGEEIPVDKNCSTHQENQETPEAKVMNR